MILSTQTELTTLPHNFTESVKQQDIYIFINKIIQFAQV